MRFSNNLEKNSGLHLFKAPMEYNQNQVPKIFALVFCNAPGSDLLPIMRDIDT